MTFNELPRRFGPHRPRCGAVRIVAIDGPGGAGKSVFAGRLARALARDRTSEGADLVVDGFPTLPHDPEVEFIALLKNTG